MKAAIALSAWTEGGEAPPPKNSTLGVLGEAKVRRKHGSEVSHAKHGSEVSHAKHGSEVSCELMQQVCRG